MDKEEIIREHFAKLGRTKSPAKTAAAHVNRQKALAKISAPIRSLERGYQAVKTGKSTFSRGARDVAKTSFARFRAYFDRREAGETPEQIKAKP